MSGLFDINNGFFTFMSKAFDMVLVSILWVICCIPIVTIGPATSALYYTVVKSVRKDRGYVSKEFFKAFKMNLKTGMIAGVILTVLMVVLYGNIRFSVIMIKEGDWGQKGLFLYYLYWVMLILVILLMMYVFPVLSRFTVKTGRLFKISLYMIFRHLLTTIVMAVVLAAAALGIVVTNLMGIFLIPGLCALLQSFMMERVLRKYTPPVDEEDVSTDAWYLD